MYFKETGPVETSIINNREYQPRSKINSEKLDELKESIQSTGGNLEYVILMEKNNELITLAGHRRVQACKELGIFVNARIMEEKTEEEAWSIAIATNIKEDMSTADMIRSVGRLISFGSSEREVAKKLGISSGTAHNYSMCSQHEQSILEKIDSSELSISKAVLIASIAKTQQMFFVEQSISNGWTTELTKKYVEMWNSSKTSVKNRLKKGKITWEEAYDKYLDQKSITKLIELGFPENAPEHHKLLFARSIDKWEHNDTVYRIKVYNDYLRYNHELITLLHDNATTWDNVESNYRFQMAEEAHLEEFGPQISKFQEKWNLEEAFEILVFADREKQINEIATTLKDQFDFIHDEWIKQFKQDEDLGKLLSGIDAHLEETKKLAEDYLEAEDGKKIDDGLAKERDIRQDTPEDELTFVCENCHLVVAAFLKNSHKCKTTHERFDEELAKEREENIEERNRRELYSRIFTRSIEYINAHLDKKIKNVKISETEETLFSDLKGSINRWEALQKQGMQYHDADIDALQRIYDMQKSAYDKFNAALENEKIEKHKTVFLPLLQTIDEKNNLDILEIVEFVSGCNLMRTNIINALDKKLKITNQKSLLQSFRDTGDLQPFYDAVCEADPPFDYEGLHDACTIGYKHDVSECVFVSEKTNAATVGKEQKSDKLETSLDEYAQKVPLNETDTENHSDTKDEQEINDTEPVKEEIKAKIDITGLTKLDELHYIDFQFIKEQVKQLHNILAIKYDLTKHLELVEASTDLLLEETKNILEYKKRGYGLLKQPPNEKKHEILKCNLVKLLENDSFIKMYELKYGLPEEIHSRVRDQVIQFSLILIPSVADQRVIMVPWISFGPTTSKHYWGGNGFIFDSYPDFFEVFKP